VRTQRVEVYVVDVAGKACQQVGEAQDRPLGGVEELLVSSRAWLTQTRDLFVGEASPLRRSGMRTRSILTAVEDRRA
jgi:hypothetical protein